MAAHGGRLADVRQRAAVDFDGACDSSKRFGFKCEPFADSDPCPDLVPGAVVREPAAGAPPKSERSALGDCANEVIPCQQCATDAPCPFLGGLQNLRIGSADTAGVAAAGAASA